MFHPTDIPTNNPNGIKIGDPKGYHVAPYALFCEPDGEDYCYVSVRGTLNGPDGGLDLQANLLPSPFGANEDIYGKVAQGFNKGIYWLRHRTCGQTKPWKTLYNTRANTY